MYCWFRGAKVVGAALAGRKRSLFDESVLAMRVWPGDLDANMHMNNGRYLALMDLGRFDMVLRAGLLGPLMKKGWRPMLAGSSIRYSRSLAPFSRFTLHTRLVYWDDKWAYMEQEFRQKGKVAARALVKGLFARAGGGHVPLAEIAAYLGLDPNPPEPPPGLIAWQRWEDSLYKENGNGVNGVGG